MSRAIQLSFELNLSPPGDILRLWVCKRVWECEVSLIGTVGPLQLGQRTPAFCGGRTRLSSTFRSVGSRTRHSTALTCEQQFSVALKVKLLSF